MANLGDGNKSVTTAGTRVALAPSQSVRAVAITAKLANTGVIVVGSSTVVASVGTRQGTPLNAGDTMIINDVDMAEVFLDSTVNGEGVVYTYKL